MNQIIQYRKFCLASSSPRRHELLKRYGFTFDSISPNIDETQQVGENVQQYGERIAREKASSVQSQFQDSIILSGDTIVYFDQQILGKPEDREEAKQILRKLSGQQHEVYSAYALLDTKSEHCIEGIVATSVQFKTLSDDWINFYTNTDEPMDKAGAYSIQGVGSVMVEKINGSYNNVVGYPIEEIFWHMLDQKWIGFSLGVVRHPGIPLDGIPGQ